MDPEIKKLLIASKPTEFPGIFENKAVNLDKSKASLFVFIGPTGSGKSTFVKDLAKKYPKVKTATTRTEMREDENEDSFLWIKENKFEDEAWEDFQFRLEHKYGLLESNLFAGNIYGTPKDEVEKALENGNAVINMENNGAKVLLAKLSHQINIIIFFVLPDSFEELKKRAGANRNDLEERLRIAKKEIEDSSEITNFYIHNTETNIYSGNENPLEFIQNSLKKFIQNILVK